MKILVLTDRYPPFYEGGYELNCHQVTEGLIARRHEATVITSTFGLTAQAVNGHVHRVLRLLNTNYQGRLRRRWIQLKRLFQARQNYQLARRLAKEINPDLAFVWHLQGTSILPILAVQDLGIRTVFRIGSHWLIQDKQVYVDEHSRSKRCYRSGLIGFRRFEELKIDSGIVVSETLKQSYHQANFNIKNMVVIPSGIPSEWIAERTSVRPSAEKPLRLLYAGRLEALKGTDVALGAMEHLVEVRNFNNVSLDLIGNGEPEYVENLKRRIGSSNLQEFVRLKGFLPRLQLLQHYGQYDVFLFPTTEREGLPMTVIEAMSQGVPVIASDIGGPKDIIEDGGNGLLVPPNEPAKLAEAIEKIISAPSLAAEIGSAAIQTVRQKYTSDRMLDQYETVLEGLLR